MAPTSRVFLTRHAQAEHNVAGDYTILDAPLTPLGKKQAAALGPVIASLQQEADVLISSPLRRTLQTTMLGYKDAVERLGGPKHVVVLPQMQGSDRAVLESDPEFSVFELSALTPEWNSKAGFYAPDSASLDARAQWLRQYLRARPEQNIVAVAHGDILRHMIQEEHPWTNAEVRLFQFDPAAVDSDACPLVAIQNVAAGGHTDYELEQHLQDATDDTSLSAVESRVKQMYVRLTTPTRSQAHVESQASELEALDRRLAAADAKKAQLETQLG
ncbi:hypothetical protein MVES1_001348 [Malassezia vespertilionis]|uniref:uncharacterized protein n=1 Tax=Malassezia vespertilionis TaxID=2020962 RepID=UPI0024B14026|nr:uncharacterized protein MVES1_001348 [Malassezia vespertilionis]WFD06010.1 hypothetical protein MVES1_001348 [Malassezia vespertilionis]